MKTTSKLLLIATFLGLVFISNPVYGQQVPLTPPSGNGVNNGGSRSPDEFTCPLSLYYNQTIDQLEFENDSTSSVTFTYYIYDEDENMICNDTICINANSSYLLNLNSVSGETYTIYLEVDDILYEGKFGL